jgi:hypothetical protein
MHAANRATPGAIRNTRLAEPVDEALSGQLGRTECPREETSFVFAAFWLDEKNAFYRQLAKKHHGPT